MAYPENKENLVVGYKQVLKAAKSGLCEKIFIADDCSEKISGAIFAAADGASVIRVPSMRELGRNCGIDVPASCAAIIRL